LIGKELNRARRARNLLLECVDWSGAAGLRDPDRLPANWSCASTAPGSRAERGDASLPDTPISRPAPRTNEHR
jgi:hypothetical protein